MQGHTQGLNSTTYILKALGLDNIIAIILQLDSTYCNANTALVPCLVNITDVI